MPKSSQKPKQAPLFPSGEELPLFSGTPQRAQVEQFHPKPEQQPALFRFCRVCFGSGLVRVHKNRKPIKCTCQL